MSGEGFYDEHAQAEFLGNLARAIIAGPPADVELEPEVRTAWQEASDAVERVRAEIPAEALEPVETPLSDDEAWGLAKVKASLRLPRVQTALRKARAIDADSHEVNPGARAGGADTMADVMLSFIKAKDK